MEATFCFVDIAGYTALTETHGAEAAADLVDRFAALVEEALGGEGRLAERVGDAVLVVVPAPAAAVRFVARLFARVEREPDFPVLRAGLHQGEALERGGRLYGAGVNVAARVTAQARGGQALATGAVAEAARADGVAATSVGIAVLRNVRDPVELFALGVLDDTSTAAIDPVCRMRVDRERAAGVLRHAGVVYWFCSLDCARRFAARPDDYLRDL
jgi:class 3 adenylate cyclase/YHS domain-containing protein